jgi:hypothetical protein
MKKNRINASCFPYAVIDRRIAVERRKFSYANCIPERRSGIDRRGIGSAAYRANHMAETAAGIKYEYFQ